MWLWTPNGKWMMALNAKWDYSSECHNANVATNLKWKMNNGYERQTEDTTLNAKWEMNNGSEHQTEGTTLNAKMKMWLWTPNGKWAMALNAKRKMNNGSERQN